MKRTQIGWLIIAIIGIIDCLVLYENHNFSTIIITIGMSLLLILLFYKLTILIDDEFVRFSFGIGLIRGKFRLSTIEYCRPTQYFPLGWGIRIRPGVILFNVSGTKAIELSFRGKFRKIWIGTDYPDELSGYINSKTIVK
jgi:hypothetical protein